MSEVQIARIHGKPEDWLRDFLAGQLREHAGRIYGFCLHLEILAPDGDSSGATVSWEWPSAAQMQGRLMTTVTQIGLRHLGVTEKEGA